MKDEQTRLLLSLTGDEARLLLDHNEYALYRNIQNKMVKLVREYDVRLPLSCLQFMYYTNRLSRRNTDWCQRAEVIPCCSN